jgi:hypothetical protein
MRQQFCPPRPRRVFVAPVVLLVLHVLPVILVLISELVCISLIAYKELVHERDDSGEHSVRDAHK